MVCYKSERTLATLPLRVEGANPAQKLEIVPQELLFGSGRLLSELILVPGAQIPVHTHNGEFEVFLILSGEAEYYDNGKTVTLTAGDIAVCREGETHGIKNVTEKELTLVAFVGFPNPEKQI